MVLTVVWFLCFPIFLFLWIKIVIDIFKKNVPLGFVGLFFFPYTFYYVIRFYSGNRKIVGGLLYASALFLFGGSWLQTNVASKELLPFLEKIKLVHGYDCIYTKGWIMSKGFTKYKIFCKSEKMNSIKYTSVEEMLNNFENQLIKPIIPVYQETFGQIKDKGTIIYFVTEGKMAACFTIKNPDQIVEKWYTGLEDPCKH